MIRRATPGGQQPRGIVVTALGLMQVLAWGSSYYLPAVLSRPIADDTGWAFSAVVGGFSVALLAAGLVSRQMGRAVQRHGGRPVLATSSVLMAVGLASIGLAPNLVVYLVAWAVMGLGMGTGLYDAAFSTVGRLYGSAARGAITTLTLFGGFASTVCWPLSAFLVETLGWRATCFAYAALQIGVALPTYWLALPSQGAPRQEPSSAQARADQKLDAEARRPVRMFLLLAAVWTISSVVMTVMSVHLLSILQAQGIGPAAAVGFGALVGPSQVGARALEMALGRRYHPIWTAVVSASLVTSGITLLLLAPQSAAIALVIYGAGNGLISIARGTLPLAIFGSVQYAMWMGLLALPSFLAAAVSPLIGAVLLEIGGATGTLAALSAFAILNLAVVGVLWRVSDRVRADRR